MKPAVFWTIAILAVLAVGGMFASAYMIGYGFDRDVGGYLNLADDASTATLKLEYLCQYREAVRAKVTGEDARLIFKTPQTKTACQLAVLDSLVVRVQETTTLDMGSFEYQQAMSQITGQEFEGALMSTNRLLKDAYLRQGGWSRFLWASFAIPVVIGLLAAVGLLALYCTVNPY